MKRKLRILKPEIQVDEVAWFLNQSSPDKSENERWLETPNQLKRLELLEQKLADGQPLTETEIREYDRLDSPNL